MSGNKKYLRRWFPCRTTTRRRQENYIYSDVGERAGELLHECEICIIDTRVGYVWNFVSVNETANIAMAFVTTRLFKYLINSVMRTFWLRTYSRWADDEFPYLVCNMKLLLSCSQRSLLDLVLSRINSVLTLTSSFLSRVILICISHIQVIFYPVPFVHDLRLTFFIYFLHPPCLYQNCENYSRRDYRVVWNCLR